MSSLLPACLFVVMLAQGAALTPAQVGWHPGSRHALLAGLLLRMIALPVLGWLSALLLGLDDAGSAGLLLAALAPPAVAALALGGLGGANVPILATLILAGSVVSLLWLPLIAGAGLGGPAPAFAAVMTWVALPMAIGIGLRRLIGRSERMLAMLASVLTGAMMLAAIWHGWTAAAENVAEAAILLALAGALAAMMAARAAGLDAAATQAVTLASTMPAAAVPIGLAAAAADGGAGFGALALPGAVHGIAAYAVVLGLLVLRLRARGARGG